MARTFFRTLSAFAVALILPFIASAETSGQSALSRVDAELLDQARAGKASSFFVILKEQADLSAASSLPSKIERGRYVFERLREVAARTQPAVIAAIEKKGLRARSFYITNSIKVETHGGFTVATSQILEIAERSDVSRLVPERVVPQPVPAERSHAPSPGGEVAWNLEQIGASQLHARGVTGAGVVIGVSDSGMHLAHPALESRYRGNTPEGVSHDYNWFDPTEERSLVPVDTNGHGTHTTGIAVGGPPGEATGVAPGAQWIGCRGIGPGSSRETVLDCLQFFLAPTDVHGANPNPDKAPDVTNHSYICPFCGLEDAFQALRDAGIAVVAGTGNFGPTCESVFDPGTYANVLTIGSIGADGLLSEFSSRGPVGEGLVKPELVAPGDRIRSSVSPAENDGLFYAEMSGTSMAAPHVAGAIALVWSARPSLKNEVGPTEQYLFGLASPTEAGECGTAPQMVNDLYGYGAIDLRRVRIERRRVLSR